LEKVLAKEKDAKDQMNVDLSSRQSLLRSSRKSWMLPDPSSCNWKPMFRTSGTKMPGFQFQIQELKAQSGEPVAPAPARAPTPGPPLPVPSDPASALPDPPALSIL